MKDTTKKPIDEILEAWKDAPPGIKFSVCWIAMLVVGLITVGIIFPWVGLILLAIVVVLITVGVFIYLDENI
jgi:Flp pilus assembly protein TadB